MGRSGLLLDERMVSAQPSLVRELGLVRAIVLQQIHWHMAYADHGKEHDGETWFPITQPDLAREIGLSDDAIHRAVRSLEDAGLLLSCQPEGHKSRRKWYRIDHDHPAISRDQRPRDRDTPSRDIATSSSTKPDEPKTEQGLAPAARKRDPHWDALVDCWSIDTTELTTAERGRLNKACGELRAIGADPAEIPARRAMYALLFPDAAQTVMALVNRWAECRPDPARLFPRPSRGTTNILRALSNGAE